jgi:hypothetical protein
MSAVQVIRSLLTGSATVVAICPAIRIIIGTVPQSTPMPSLSISHISTVAISRIDAQAEYGLVTSRIQVTAMAGNYSAAKALIDASRKACNFGRGELAGVSVVSVVRDTVGPDLSNDEATIHFQTIDFKVAYFEQN